MKTYLAILRHQLTSLHRFSGRDTSGTFWAWGITVLCLMFLAFGAAAQVIIGTWFARIEKFAREHPELATRTAAPGGYSVQVKGTHPELMPDFESFIGLTAGFMLVTVVLLAAPLTRRLHDTGRRGFWGLVPLPFLISGLWYAGTLFRDIAAAPDMRIFAMLLANNLIYLATVAMLIVFTVQRGTPGPNRFGPPPA